MYSFILVGHHPEFLEPRLGPCFLPRFCIRGKRLTASEVFTKFIVYQFGGNVAKYSANAIKFVTDKHTGRCPNVVKFTHAFVIAFIR